MTLISWVNGIYGLVSCNQHFQLLLQKSPRNAWKYFKVIWKSQGILFCLTGGNPVFGLRTQVGPGNHVFDGGARSPMGRSNFEGEGAFHCKVCDTLGSSVQKPLNRSRGRLGYGLGLAQGITY